MKKSEAELNNLIVEKLDNNHLKIIMPNDFSYVRSVRSLCLDFIKKYIDNKDIIFQIEILLDEVCNNAIEHGSPIYRMQNITVDVLCDYAGATVRVADGGKGINDNKENADTEDYRKREEIFRELKEIRRGRGLLLVKELSTNFEINLDPVKGSTIEFRIDNK